MLAGALGELALHDGEAAVAVEHFQRAIDLHAEIELPHDRAELLVSAAAAAHAAGRDDQARAWLGEARLQARRLGCAAAPGGGRAPAGRPRRRHRPRSPPA